MALSLHSTSATYSTGDATTYGCVRCSESALLFSNHICALFLADIAFFLRNILRAYRVGVGVNLDLIFPPPFSHIHVRVRCSCTDMIVAIRCDTCTSKRRVFANIQWYIQRAAYRYDQSHASKRVQYRTVAINVFFPGFKYKKILSHPA
jgi:hypothetical protein